MYIVFITSDSEFVILVMSQPLKKNIIPYYVFSTKLIAKPVCLSLMRKVKGLFSTCFINLLKTFGYHL